MSKNHVNAYRGEKYFTPDKYHVKEEPMTPSEDYDFDEDNFSSQMRKSLSLSDINAIQQNIDRKYKYRGTATSQELSQRKFVSMAEAIYHFQRDTPGRFHSTRPTLFQSQGYTGPKELTRPQSPILRSKGRSRSAHVVSQKEKEEMELEELKKYKIKANPIPRSVLEGAHLPEVPKLPLTIPEPFHLTEPQRKEYNDHCEVPAFKARPAPKHILEKPFVPVKPPIHVTKPVSPRFLLVHRRANSQDPINIGAMKPVANASSMAGKPKDKDENQKPRQGPVKPIPFSFEKRDEELKRRKDEKIKEQIERERKQASLFKAQPLPVAVKKRMQQTVGKSNSSNSSENKENHKFEARPPVVLYKEPFKPTLNQIQPVKPAPFDLSTTKRAAEREKFDQHLKEKEAELELLRLKQEEDLRKQEEKANAELRAKLVHHPKPVPIGSPFVPEKSSMPITIPETPKFVRRLKQ